MAQINFVYVIEDDLETRALLREVLELEGYYVKTAPNGYEALSLLSHDSSSVYLILLDLLMPVMNGWEFLEAADSIIKARSIPVIIMSVTNFQKSSLPKTVFDGLRKPLDIDVLLSMIYQGTHRKTA
jgi:CheY-like chemotaxis protein